MLVVFCCMAISCFSTGDYTTDTGPDPSREGTTVCAHPNDDHIYLVGNKTCYIVLPASHFEHLCPMGYQCRGAGGFFMQDAAVKTSVHVFSFFLSGADYIVFLTLDTSHSLCSS